MSNYNCLTMMILRRRHANYGELTSLINKIEDDPSRPEYIQTVRGVGYRMNMVKKE